MWKIFLLFPGILSTLSKITTKTVQEKCILEAATSCFQNLTSHLYCGDNPLSKSAQKCDPKTAINVCTHLGDAIDCSRKAVSSACNVTDMTTSPWMQVAQKTNTYLCSTDQDSWLSETDDYSNCFSAYKTFRCTEKLIRVSNFEDLVSVLSDPSACSAIIPPLSVCIKESGSKQECFWKRDYILHLMAVALNVAPCGEIILNNFVQSECDENSRNSTGMTIFGTVLASGLSILAIFVALIKKRVLVRPILS